MKDKPIWSQTTSKPLVVLVDFCNIFNEAWADERIVEWIAEGKASPIPEEVISKFKQLESKIQILIGIVEAARQYIHSFAVPPSDNSDYWSRDHLKCITHDLLDRLLRIKRCLEFLFEEVHSEQEREKIYQVAIRYLKEISLLIEKAFPLLKINKSYLDDIDWPSELEKL